MHLTDPHPDVTLPSIEGILLGSWLSRRLTHEFRIAVPTVLLAAGGNTQRLADARELRIPLGMVAFYEVIAHHQPSQAT